MLAELKTTLRHSSVYGIANILKKGAAFFMIPVYTHYLSPADYGLLELLELILDVVVLLVGIRMGDAIIRYYNHYDETKDKMAVISTAFIFSFLIAFVSVLICQVLAKPISGMIFGTVENYRYLVWIFFCLGFQLMFIVPESFLIVTKRSATFSTISFACFLLALSLNIYFLVVLKMGVWGMIYSMAITKLFNMVLLFIFLIPKLKFDFSLNKLSELIHFSLPIIPGAISLFVINFSDRFFIQKFCGGYELGLYSLGYKFGALLIILVSDPFFRIWDTQRFEIAKQPDGSKMIGGYFTLYVFVISFFSLGLCVFATDVIDIMASESYQGAALIIPLIAISYIFQGVANFSTIGIMISYKTKYYLYSHVATATINIILNLVLIRNFGIYGAAASTIMTYFILFVVVMTISQKLYPLKFEILRIIKILIVATGLYIISLWVDEGLIVSIILKGGICLAFPVMLWVTGFFTKSELSNIKQIAAARLNRG